MKLGNPFQKAICIQIWKNNCDLHSYQNTVSIKEQVTFDNIFGIFYDRTLEVELEEHIKNDDLFRTDLENLAAIYYVHSQEQSTFGEHYAHDMAMKDKELEIELARKRGKQSSI
jgi:hypothetical protein